MVSKKECDVCDGNGTVPCIDCDGRGVLFDGSDCQTCDCDGEVPCEACHEKSPC
jgi:hypothetical protein